jgi:hypothetical protein
MDYVREGPVNDYIKVLAYRPSFSFMSKVATLDGAHTLDLRPAFSFPGSDYTHYILRIYPMTQESSSDISQNDKFRWRVS